MTSSLGGRTESLIGFWVHTMSTKKRHLILTLRKSMLCRCGCRGWCTVAVALQFLAFHLAALRDGARPSRRHDGTALDPTAAALQRDSPLFPVRMILQVVKVDWMELATTFGLSNWSSFHAPCPICLASLPQLHVGYSNCSLLALPWPEPAHDAYENACRRCEIQVRIRTLQDVRRVLHGGCLTYLNKARGRGRTITRAVPTLGLLPGDRLEPSRDLPDVGAFVQTARPFTAIFWRRSLDERGRCTDRVAHRNPLFCEPIGRAPHLQLGQDVLHGIYYGPVMAWTSATLWRILIANPGRLQAVSRTAVSMASLIFERTC